MFCISVNDWYSLQGFYFLEHPQFSRFGDGFITSAGAWKMDRAGIPSVGKMATMQTNGQMVHEEYQNAAGHIDPMQALLLIS